MKVTIKDRQSLMDIAVICGGSVETAAEIAEANGLDLSAQLEEGTVLHIPEPLANAESRIAERYALLDLEPATELSADEVTACPYGGINYMAIEIDFIVS